MRGDIAEFQTVEGKLFLFVGFDRTSKFAVTNVYHTPWAEMIKAAKTSLACWNVDTQAIWDRFLAFNKARGNSAVPAGFLLGFMRKWRVSWFNFHVFVSQPCSPFTGLRFWPEK